MGLNLDLSDVFTVPPQRGDLLPRELLTEVSPGIFLFVFDNAAAEKIMKCETAAMYYLVYRREAYVKSAALTFGGAIHIGLEAFARGELPAQVKSKIFQYFIENPTMPDEYRTPALAWEVVKNYDLITTKLEILSDSSDLILERPFELPLGVIEANVEIHLPDWPEPRLVKEIHVAWSGKIDAVAAICGNRIVDHKTSSSNFTPASYLISNQFIGYVWAARQLWPELEICGALLDGIQVKKLAKATGLLAPGPRGGPPALTFHRHGIGNPYWYNYSSEQIARWERNALTLAEDFIHCLTRNYFTRRTQACFQYFTPCQYHEVCCIDDSALAVRTLLSDSFKEVTWNPTNK